MMYFLKLDTVGGHELLWIYHSADKVLKYIPRTLKDGMGNEQTLKYNEHQLLMYYINHPNKIIIKKDIERALNVPDDVDYLKNHRGAIADKFVASSGSNIPNIKQDIFKKGLHKNSTKTIFAFDVKKISEEIASQYCSRHVDNIMKNNQYLTNIYQALLDMNELHQLEMSADYFELFDYLLKKCPDEATSLYRVDDVVLPFMVPQKHHVIFPVAIDTKTSSVQHKYQDSLLKQRKLLNAKLYNGYIYRLLKHNQQTGELTLANCRYFDSLDSADYLSSRLKVYHQKSIQEGMENIELLRVVKIWQERMAGVLQGDFSGYNSGFGFSLPIFRVLYDGGLELLSLKGSEQKAIWAKKQQICPSGTLEYWSEYSNTTLTFENFKTIVTKELFEENLLGDAHVCEKIIKTFPNLRHCLSCLIDGGEPSEIGMSFDMIKTAYREVVNLWDGIWRRIDMTPPSLEPLWQIESTQDTSKLFLIIDGLNHRPEIVFPLYVENELSTMVNWEYSGEDIEIIRWKNIEELNDWVKSCYKAWSTPSLAAAYLGAKQYFEAKH